MPIEQIIQQLRAERDRLDSAIKALTGVAGSTNREKPSPRKGTTLSAAARRRISIAQKARWAKRKSSGKPGAATPKRTVSAASRRKMAAAQRARWAKVKAGKKS